jgi:hypothetical protein
MQRTKTKEPVRGCQKALRSALAFAVGLGTLIGSGTLLAEAVRIEKYGLRSNIRQSIHATKILRGYQERQTRYLFLGDSLSMENSGGGKPPQHLLAAAIRENDGGNHFGNFSIPGFTLFSHYFLNGPIAEVGARKVIIGFNLGWVSRPLIRQPVGLEGFLPPEQWFTAMQLPIGAAGLTAADILSAGGVDQLGLRPERAWLQEIQKDVNQTYKLFVSHFQKSIGAPKGMVTFLKMYRFRNVQTEFGERLQPTSAALVLGKVLAGLGENEPTLEILGELVRRLHAKGSEVLVVAQPMNVEHLRSIGVLEDANLQSSIRRLRDVTIANGGEFLDFHQKLPDRAFRDSQDHINFQDSSNPAATIAAPLIKWILKP